ncbi:MAG: ester cyclase [Sphingobacteriales bacterium]|nr:MAG: ester cyclase [Sphingobacteriales bacterium]
MKNGFSVVSDYFAAIDSANVNFADNFSHDFEFMPALSPVPLDKNGWAEIVVAIKTGFPDGHHELSDFIADENKVAVKGAFIGTNTGSMMGNPATGNKVVLPFISLFELNEEGKIKSIMAMFDNKSFESQLMAGIDPRAAAEAIVKGIMDASDTADVEQLVSYFTPDAKHHFCGVTSGNNELKMRVAGFKAAFPDIKRNLEVLSFSDNIISCKGFATGTNTGMFMGQPATGNKMKLSVMGAYKFNSEGKISESWVEMDTASMVNQLKGNAILTEMSTN